MNLENILPVFENESLKNKLLDKYKPGFSLRIGNNGEIQTVKASIDKIPNDKIEISKEIKYFENNFFSEDKSSITLKSKGLTDVNINFSKKISNFLNIGMNEDFKSNYSDTSSKNEKRIHCIHSIYVSLINVTVDEKDIVLKNIIKEKFKDCLSKKENKEKKNGLFELFDLYGMFVPLEFTLGGKYNISFEAKDIKEKDEITNTLSNLTKLSLDSNNLDIKHKNNKANELNKEVKKSKYSISLEGGDISLKFDFDEWLKSLSLNNLEIIDFRTLVKIYDFCGDLKNEINYIIEQEKKIEKREGFNQLIYCFDKPDITLKIMLLGDAYVGKTSLINRLASGTFLQFYECTVSLDFVPIYKKLKIDDKEYLVKVTLVDTVGTEMHESVGNSFIKQCDGFMLVYDISNINGLKKIKEWKQLIDNNSKKNKAIILVGNKSDLERKISKYNAEKLSDDLNIMFGEESTCKDLNNINIEKNMYTLIYKVTEEIIKNKEKEIDNNIKIEKSRKEGGGGGGCNC